MENASKALIMAGGILLAMMILALVIYVTTSMTSMQEAQDTRIAAQQLEEFNNSYLVYNKTIMYGADVLSVYNKAKNEDEYDIKIVAIDNSETSISIDNSHNFKISIFKCEEEKIEYNEEGRISKMIFKKIEIEE